MPELPEVEIVRREIAPVLEGRGLLRVRIGAPSPLFLTPPRVLARQLPGRRVIQLARRGKYLLARLDDDRSLLLHLGMTGRLLAVPAGATRRTEVTSPLAAHVHLALHLEGGGSVLFQDVRKFGRVRLLSRDGSDPRLDLLGPEATEIGADTLRERLAGRRIAIKTALLDQRVLAGVGNIYADEALFEARLRPTRRASSLRPRDFAALAEAVRAVLGRALAAGGSTIRDYRHPDGASGGFQHEHRVYGRAGEPCVVCGEALRRTVLAQRSAHWCARCQR